MKRYKYTSFSVPGDGGRELPWWMTRWLPQWLLNIMPQWLFERVVILGTIRGRSSGEQFTQLKIYLGHTAIAFSLAALAVLFVPIQYAYWVAGIAALLWWVVAEIYDWITFGLSLDMLYDGLEYAGGFLPFFVFAVSHSPWLAGVALAAWFVVWFRLLPERELAG